MTLFFKQRWQGIEASACVWISVMTHHIMGSSCLTVLKQPFLTQVCQNSDVTDPCTCNYISHDSASHFSADFTSVAGSGFRGQAKGQLPLWKARDKSIKTSIICKMEETLFLSLWPLDWSRGPGESQGTRILSQLFIHTLPTFLFSRQTWIKTEGMFMEQQTSSHNTHLLHLAPAVAMPKQLFFFSSFLFFQIVF